MLQEHMISSHEICFPGLLLLSLRGSSALTEKIGECSGKLPRAVESLTRAVENLPLCSGNHIHSAVESCPLQLQQRQLCSQSKHTLQSNLSPMRDLFINGDLIEHLTIDERF